MKHRSKFVRAALAILCFYPGAAVAATLLDQPPTGNPGIFSDEGFDVFLLDPNKGYSQSIAENFQAIRYDPRGVGRSDNPTEPYSDADDLEELIVYLGYKRVATVGVSSAGGIALEFALAHSNRTSAVVAAAPFVPGFPFDEAMMKRLQVFSDAAEQGREPFLDSMFDDAHFIPAPLAPEVRDVARRNMAENFDKGASFDPRLTRLASPPVMQRLEELRVPMLLLVGELDHPEIHRRNEFFKGEIAGSEARILSSAGHNSPLENPTAFVDEVVPFLDRALAAVR